MFDFTVNFGIESVGCTFFLPSAKVWFTVTMNPKTNIVDATQTSNKSVCSSNGRHIVYRILDICTILATWPTRLVMDVDVDFWSKFCLYVIFIVHLKYHVQCVNYYIRNIL